MFNKFIHSLPTLFLLFCGLVMVGMIYAPYLLSVGLLGMLGASLIRYFPALKTYFRHPEFWIISLLFVVVLLGFWSLEDLHFWQERLRVKLPFLLLPIAFFLVPRLSRRQFHGLLYFWVGLLFFTSIGIGIHYLLNQEEIITLMQQGHPIPTPRNHIRFSISLAFGVISGIYLIWKQYYAWRPFEKKIILIATIFLFGFIHFLSVRTGIVALYAALGIIIFSQTILHKKYFLGLGLVLLLGSLPLIGYQFIPSFKAKINYMKWDMQMYLKGEGGNYADAGRMTSLKVGYDIFRKHPIMGIGPGNLRMATKKIYQEEYPDYVEALTPHNQFLYTLAGSGLVGITLFSIAFLFPFFYQKNYQNPLFLGFYGILFTSFILEHSIENALGIGFCSFFLLLMVNYLNGRENLNKKTHLL